MSHENSAGHHCSGEINEENSNTRHGTGCATALKIKGGAAGRGYLNEKTTLAPLVMRIIGGKKGSLTKSKIEGYFLTSGAKTVKLKLNAEPSTTGARREVYRELVFNCGS